MTPEEELKLVMSRLEKNGHKGMLLLHDNHPWTAAMVPMLLQRVEGQGLQGRPHGRRARERPDRPGAARLDFGDRTGDRRAEAAAREVGPKAGRRPDPGEARADGVGRRNSATEFAALVLDRCGVSGSILEGQASAFFSLAQAGRRIFRRLRTPVSVAPSIRLFAGLLSHRNKNNGPGGDRLERLDDFGVKCVGVRLANREVAAMTSLPADEDYARAVLSIFKARRMSAAPVASPGRGEDGLSAQEYGSPRRFRGGAAVRDEPGLAGARAGHAPPDAPGDEEMQTIPAFG